MKKVILGAALGWVLISGVLIAGRQAAQPAAPAPARAAAAQGAPAARAATAATATPQQVKATLDRYCVTCHNQRLNIPAGEPLHLDVVDLNDVEKHAETWERVIRKLNVGAMPPQGSPKPEAAQLAGLVSFVSTALDRAADARNNAGRFVLHRMNRTEYQNAIRDLLAIDVDVTALLPPDSADFGFDNVATALKTSPSLLERYLTAAINISTLAVGDPQVEPVAAQFPIRIDQTQDEHLDGLPLGTRGGTMVRYNFPADGRYDLSAALVRTLDHGDAGIEGHDTPHAFEILIDGIKVHSGTIGGPEDHAVSGESLAIGADAVAERMKARVAVAAGSHDVAFTFVERPGRIQELLQPSLRSSQDLHMAGGLPKLKYVTIRGPFDVTGVGDTASRRRLFVCTPSGPADETRCARAILSTVARRAYRRPVTAMDLESPMAFYAEGRRVGNFEAGIRAALPRILASPSFVFRAERDLEGVRVGSSHPVTDLELASRLSFFLWSSIPDDELLNLAIQGRLRAPGVMERQVRRMIADERSNALVSNFTGQWLALRNLERVVPDLVIFPEFDHNLRSAFQKETELFFASVMRGDRPALELLTADYTFVNERLARHYGIPRVYGSHFRRVQITDPNRRGLLGHASILSITSIATRTSPVIRGKYILANFLNTPPLPPPPNVANVLPPEAEASEPKTVRERLETHRQNPVCASCHRSMDPLGFALENFDAIGQWRSVEAAGTPVDSSGVLVDGTPVNGPIALRQALLSRPAVFVNTMTERLMIYALGRGLEPYDKPVVRDIVGDAARNSYRFSSIIMGIVQSRPFQMRMRVADAGDPTPRTASTATPAAHVVLTCAGACHGARRPPTGDPGAPELPN